MNYLHIAEFIREKTIGGLFKWQINKLKSHVDLDSGLPDDFDFHITGASFAIVRSTWTERCLS